MYRTISILLLAFTSACTAPGAASLSDEGLLLGVCTQFLEDYSAGRYDAVEARFAPKAVVAIDAVDSGKQTILSAEAFISSSRSKTDEGIRFRERFNGRPTVRVDHNIACVWSPYRIESTLGDSSGFDVFQLIRLEGEWRIVCLSYTNRKDGA